MMIHDVVCGSNGWRRIVLLAVVLAGWAMGGTAWAHDVDEAMFRHDVATAQKPWTHLQFANDPADFQFVIVSDNTGGSRPGVFESAVGKLNLLQPEFVMSVGDLIEGYTKDHEQIDAEWAVFNAWARDIEAPFFYVPGNHDISNPVMRTHWEQRYGVRYYSFVYKNVLFVMMDSDDSEDTAWYSVSDEQERFVMETLTEHADVRWTFFFMHHPLWTRESNELKAIEGQLATDGRGYTMFAGHNHRYMHHLRQGSHYYVLATTGGGSHLRGPRFGEFDHVTWVTVTDDGPIMANLQLEGIHDMDVYNPDVDRLARALLEAARFEHVLLTAPTETFSAGTLLVRVENTSTQPLLLEGRFFHHHQVNVSEPDVYLRVAEGTTEQLKLDLTGFTAAAVEDLDPLQLQWTLSYEESPYPGLKLSGAYSVELQPTEAQTIDTEREIFTDRITVSPRRDLDWDGVSLHYTLDGRQPTRQSPEFSSELTFQTDGVLTVQALNAQGHATAAEVRRFQKVTPIAAEAVSAVQPGLVYTYYEGMWTALPDFAQEAPLSRGVAQDFDVARLSAAHEHYGIVFKGYLRVPTTGVYLFATTSDDGSAMYVHDQLVVDNDGWHGPELRTGYIALAAGFHPIRIEFFEHAGAESLQVEYQDEHMTERQAIPAAWFGHD